jgi:hypothetical protein
MMEVTGSALANGVFDVAMILVACLLCRWHYGSEIKNLRRTAFDLGELLHNMGQEHESTRKLNVELARDKEQLGEQIHNQMFTIEAFQKRDTLLEEAKADLANKVMQYDKLDSVADQLRYELDVAVNERDAVVKENREMSDECSHLRKQAIDSERYLETFRDLSIHLDDMALEIASVAPNAKGD